MKPELLAYVDPLDPRAGERLRVHVSTPADTVDVDVVRLVHGDTNPDGPGLRVLPVASAAVGSYPGREQPLRAGSHVVPARNAAASIRWP